MSYRVFQDGKPCSEYKIVDWSIDTFETQREAEVFAFYWAYPVSKETAESSAPIMKLGVEEDYSMGETPVMMKIEEV